MINNGAPSANNIELREKLTNIRNAISEGMLEVEFDGKRIKYRSLDEMRRIENGLMQQLAGKSRRSTFQKIVTVFEKY